MTRISLSNPRKKLKKHDDSGIFNVCAEITALIQMLKIWTMLGIPRIDEITLSFCRKFKNTISSRQHWYLKLRLSRYTVYIHANRPGKRPPVRSIHTGLLRRLPEQVPAFRGEAPTEAHNVNKTPRQN